MKRERREELVTNSNVPAGKCWAKKDRGAKPMLWMTKGGSHLLSHRNDINLHVTPPELVIRSIALTITTNKPRHHHRHSMDPDGQQPNPSITRTEDKKDKATTAYEFEESSFR